MRTLLKIGLLLIIKCQNIGITQAQFINVDSLPNLERTVIEHINRNIKLNSALKLIQKTHKNNFDIEEILDVTYDSCRHYGVLQINEINGDTILSKYFDEYRFFKVIVSQNIVIDDCKNFVTVSSVSDVFDDKSNLYLIGVHLHDSSLIFLSGDFILSDYYNVIAKRNLESKDQGVLDYFRIKYSNLEPYDMTISKTRKYYFIKGRTAYFNSEFEVKILRVEFN